MYANLKVTINQLVTPNKFQDTHRSTGDPGSRKLTYYTFHLNIAMSGLAQEGISTKLLPASYHLLYNTIRTHMPDFSTVLDRVTLLLLPLLAQNTMARMIAAVTNKRINTTHTTTKVVTTVLLPPDVLGDPVGVAILD